MSVIEETRPTTRLAVENAPVDHIWIDERSAKTLCGLELERDVDCPEWCGHPICIVCDEMNKKEPV